MLKEIKLIITFIYIVFQYIYAAVDSNSYILLNETYLHYGKKKEKKIKIFSNLNDKSKKNIYMFSGGFSVRYETSIKKIVSDIEENVTEIAQKIIDYKTNIKFNAEKTSSKQYIVVDGKEVILSSIGWHYPWILLVLLNVKEKNDNLFNHFFNCCIGNYGLLHENFRVRSMTSFVLSLI